MCTITKELKSPIKATGYKLAIRVGNKYYSPCTGLEYKVGMKFPKMKKFKKNRDFCWGDNTLNKDSAYYDERMQGNTGIFDSIYHLSRITLTLNETMNYVILKMTLDNVKYEGDLSDTKIYIGNGLSAMEVIADVVEGSGLCYMKNFKFKEGIIL